MKNILHSGPNIPFGAYICFDPISTIDKSRFRQFHTKMLPGLIIGHALNSERLEPRLDLRGLTRPEVHVQRFKSKEVGFNKLQVVLFLCADGSQQQEGHAQSKILRHQRVESFDEKGVPSILAEARSEFLQSAREDFLQ